MILLPLQLEIVLQVALQQAKEPGSILLIDQPVIKDTLCLMNPKADQSLFIGKVIIFNFQYSLEHFTQISQVECVMRFCWRWQQFRTNFTIYLE